MNDVIEICEWKTGDIITNTKTNKLGIIISVYPKDMKDSTKGVYVKWCILNTPNNIHICLNPDERFKLFHRTKPVHWSYFTEDIFS